MEDFPNIYWYGASFDISHTKALIDFVTSYKVEELRPIDFRLSFWKGKVWSNSDRECLLLSFDWNQFCQWKLYSFDQF